jgi:hypothetical protein
VLLFGGRRLHPMPAFVEDIEMIDELRLVDDRGSSSVRGVIRHMGNIPSPRTGAAMIEAFGGVAVVGGAGVGEEVLEEIVVIKPDTKWERS